MNRLPNRMFENDERDMARRIVRRLGATICKPEEQKGEFDMKANKRAFRMTLGLILAAVLLICQVISVSAEEPAGNLFRLSDDVSLAYENRSDGTCAITGYQGTPATLEIPDIIEGMKVTEIAKGAFMNCESLKSVHIPESVEIISNIAFAMCPSLMELTFGSELKEIGQGAFAQCGKLEQVVLPDTVCSIGKAAFGGCASCLHSFSKGSGKIGRGGYDGMQPSDGSDTARKTALHRSM